MQFLSFLSLLRKLMESSPHPMQYNGLVILSATGGQTSLLISLKYQETNCVGW